MGKCYGAGPHTARLDSEHAPEESERIGTVGHLYAWRLWSLSRSLGRRSELTRSCGIA